MILSHQVTDPPFAPHCFPVWHHILLSGTLCKWDIMRLGSFTYVVLAVKFKKKKKMRWHKNLVPLIAICSVKAMFGWQELSPVTKNHWRISVFLSVFPTVGSGPKLSSSEVVLSSKKSLIGGTLGAQFARFYDRHWLNKHTHRLSIAPTCVLFHS